MPDWRLWDTIKRWFVVACEGLASISDDSAPFYFSAVFLTEQRPTCVMLTSFLLRVTRGKTGTTFATFGRDFIVFLSSISHSRGFIWIPQKMLLFAIIYYNDRNITQTISSLPFFSDAFRKPHHVFPIVFFSFLTSSGNKLNWK